MSRVDIYHCRYCNHEIAAIHRGSGHAPVIAQCPICTAKGVLGFMRSKAWQMEIKLHRLIDWIVPRVFRKRFYNYASRFSMAYYDGAIPQWEWYKPTPEQFDQLSPSQKDHARGGGLFLQRL